MYSADFRNALRIRTKDSHAELDEVVGAFPDIRAYGDYLRATAAFRDAVEAVLASFEGWRLKPISGFIHQDMADLGLSPASPRSFPAQPRTDAWKMGVAWVLEGSSLGARVLTRRAGALGLDADHGARHLAILANDPARWRTFLAQLEAWPMDDIDEAVAGATDAFGFALSVYGEKVA